MAIGDDVLGEEPSDLDTAYTSWKASPGPAGNTAFLKAVTPVMTSAVRTHVGPPTPGLMSHAKHMVLQSMPSYDPKAASLKTFIYSQLRGMKRINRQQNNILSVPERVQLESYSVQSAEDELGAELGRKPTTAELLDKTGMSLKRLKRVRAYRTPMAEGQFENEETGETGFTGDTSTPWHRAKSTWTDLVYGDLDPYHQSIMEHSLGLYGRRPLSNEALARKMNRSPGAISQAKARIQALLNAESTLSPFGGM